LAIQINTAINNVKNWLAQVRLDALVLIHMSDVDLTHIAGLDLLGDLEFQARHAYAGSTDPNTGKLQEGAVWISDNMERLATLDVTPYSSR
jgi:hypothetical protein